MGSKKVYATVAGFLAVAASMSTARAADLLPPPPVPMVEPIAEDFGGTWYLRGDVGVGFQDFGKQSVTTLTAGFPVSGYVGRQKEIGDTTFVGAGIGYAYNSWLRFDVTGEYRTKANWSYLEQDTNFGPANFDLTSGHFSSAVGLANVYFDLGTWYGITPFVGGGVGVAYNMFDNVKDQGLGGYAGGLGIAAPKDKANLAWAIHAGLAYSVSPNLKLEFAYRYLHMGDADAGTVVCQGGPAICGGLQVAYKLKDIESQDFKIGMRWELGGPAPVYEPAPLIRKY